MVKKITEKITLYMPHNHTIINFFMKHEYVPN